LDEKVVVRKFRTTTRHGAIADKTLVVSHIVEMMKKSRCPEFAKDLTNYYNLEMIVAAGISIVSSDGLQ